jgi:hypothetical protein
MPLPVRIRKALKHPNLSVTAETTAIDAEMDWLEGKYGEFLRKGNDALEMAIASKRDDDYLCAVLTQVTRDILQVYSKLNPAEISSAKLYGTKLQQYLHLLDNFEHRRALGMPMVILKSLTGSKRDADAALDELANRDPFGRSWWTSGRVSSD